MIATFHELATPSIVAIAVALTLRVGTPNILIKNVFTCVVLVTTTALWGGSGEPLVHDSPGGNSELRHFVDTVVVTVPIPEK
jgi:hypothetical protein